MVTTAMHSPLCMGPALTDSLISQLAVPVATKQGQPNHQLFMIAGMRRDNDMKSLLVWGA